MNQNHEVAVVVENAPAQNQLANWESPVEIGKRIAHMTEVYQQIMKPETDFGVIPGCKLPSLWQPGADLIITAFKLVPDFIVEDLSNSTEEIRYRVLTELKMAGTNIVVARGAGECSSMEEKYAWRKAVCKGEFDSLPDHKKRIKWASWQGKDTQTMQVATDARTQANTILKMAIKRAKVASVLALGAGRIFTQDLEDLPQEYIQPEHQEPTSSKPKVAQPTPKAEPVDLISESALADLRLFLEERGISEDTACAKGKIAMLEQLPANRVAGLIKAVEDGKLS